MRDLRHAAHGRDALRDVPRDERGYLLPRLGDALAHDAVVGAHDDDGAAAEADVRSAGKPRYGDDGLL